MKQFLRIAAVLSFLFCFTGGMWLLTKASFSKSDDSLAIAMGFYFVGKAFFVGPMLLVAAQKFGGGEAGK